MYLCTLVLMYGLAHSRVFSIHITSLGHLRRGPGFRIVMIINLQLLLLLQHYESDYESEYNTTILAMTYGVIA